VYGLGKAVEMSSGVSTARIEYELKFWKRNQIQRGRATIKKYLGAFYSSNVDYA